MAQKKTQDFYVGIHDPVFVRRTILESSRLAIHILQDYERLRDIRKQKLEYVQEFDKIIKEINSLMAKLKVEIPTVPQKKVKVKSSPVKKEKVSKSIKVERIIPKEKSALQALEEELNSIENELNNLN
jgi:phenylalanyl-tRNA synthetase alpha subunit